MNNAEAIHKMEFMRDAYQKLIDENVDEGRFVGTDVTGTWKADTSLNEVYAEHVEALDLAISALEKQEQGRWIPCSERLPEDDKDVLCIAKSKFGGFYCVASHGKMYPWSDEVGWITTVYDRIVESVISAWMPLPESYKAEGDNE